MLFYSQSVLSSRPTEALKRNLASLAETVLSLSTSAALKYGDAALKLSRPTAALRAVLASEEES